MINFKTDLATFPMGRLLYEKMVACVLTVTTVELACIGGAVELINIFRITELISFYTYLKTERHIGCPWILYPCK